MMKLRRMHNAMGLFLAILKARVTICVTYLRSPTVPVRCSDHKTMGKIGLKRLQRTWVVMPQQI